MGPGGASTQTYHPWGWYNERTTTGATAMTEPSKPLTNATRVTTTIGVIIASCALVFAAGAWASEIRMELRSVAQSVQSINTKIDGIEDINRRLSVVESRLERGGT